MTIFESKIINPYRAKGKWYHWLRGHTGVDLVYAEGDLLYSPITGTVVALTKQKEMGNCLYVRDIKDAIHVFAHLQGIRVKLGESVKRGAILATTGNTGTATSGAHLHYEVVTLKPVNLIDRIMIRKGLPFKGYNTDPIVYLKALYAEYRVDWKTGKSIGIPPYSF